MADEAAATSHHGNLGRLPRVYAQAMLDLAAEQGNADELLAELGDLDQILAASPQLATFLGSPLVSEKERAEVIEKTFRGRASDLLTDSLAVINHKSRLQFLSAIIAAYRSEHRELAGLVDARVTTAVPLAAAQRKELVAAIAAWSGKKPDLRERVDPAILGGMVVEVAGEKLDSSLANRLRDIGGALAARAAQEIHRGASMVLSGEGKRTADAG